MGTREVYEEKVRSANLHYDPTINPGLGPARCPRCLSLIDPNSRNREWTITSVLHDFTAVAGSGLGGLLTAVHGFNTGIPHLQKHVKGPKWVQLAIGIPPLLIFSGAGAVFGAIIVMSSSTYATSSIGVITYAVPKFAQLTVSSYYAGYSGSHCVISQATRRIEGLHSSQSLNEKSR